MSGRVPERLYCRRLVFAGFVAWRGLVPTALLPKHLHESAVAFGQGHHFNRYLVRRGELLNFVAVARRVQWEPEGWTIPAPIDEFQQEFALWEKIKAATEPRPLEDYLRRYPSGQFSELAQLRLDQVLARQGEKKVRIEVGYGLEQWITDGFAGETSRVMAPEFRNGRYGAGLLNGVTRVVARIAQGRNVTLKGVPLPDQRPADTGIPVATIIFFAVLFILMARSALRPRRTIGRWGRDGWSGWSSAARPEPWRDCSASRSWSARRSRPSWRAPRIFSPYRITASSVSTPSKAR